MIRQLFRPKINRFEAVRIQRFFDFFHIIICRFDRTAVMKSVVQVHGFGIHVRFQKRLSKRQRLEREIAVRISQFVNITVVDGRREDRIGR